MYIEGGGHLQRLIPTAIFCVCFIPSWSCPAHVQQGKGRHKGSQHPKQRFTDLQDQRSAKPAFVTGLAQHSKPEAGCKTAAGGLTEAAGASWPRSGGGRGSVPDVCTGRQLCSARLNRGVSQQVPLLRRLARAGFSKGALKPTPAVWGEPSGDDPREWYSVNHLQQLKSDVGGHPRVSDKSGSEEHATCIRKTRARTTQKAQTSSVTPSRKNGNSTSRGCLAQHSRVYFRTKSTRTEKTIITQIKKPWRRESPTNLQLNFKDFIWKQTPLEILHQDWTPTRVSSVCKQSCISIKVLASSFINGRTITGWRVY